MHEMATHGTKRRATVAAGAVATLALLGMSAPAGAATMSPGNGNSYEVVQTGSITWAQAKAAAEASNLGGPLCPGHLATITSKDENDFLKATFGNSLFVKWLGARQDPANLVDGGWTWVTGEPWGFTEWGPGEPNNGFYSAWGYENALAFYSYSGVLLWNDAPENYPYGAAGGYVVEYECRQVAIDVKPDSSVNPVNNNGNGVIPVAILTTDTFDAATVDPFSVTLDGAAARVKGKSGKAGVLEDVDGDGDLDLLVHIVDADGTYVTGVDTVATLTAKTYSGEDIAGQDTIRLVPPA